MFTDMKRPLECDGVLLVSSRVENNAVYNDLKLREAEWADAGIKSVKLIGDANAPGPIAWATYAGHRYARELDGDDIGDALPFRREITQLAVD
jgi:dimethylamine/trimethylamine dehydrogenase